MFGLRMNRAVLTSLLALAGLAGVGHAQTFSGTYAQPSLDRWNYPFSSQPGAERFLPTFGAIQIPGFDDRDGQMLVGFNTAADIPTNLPPEWYTVESMKLTVWVAVDEQFVYDPSFDSFVTLLPNADPRHVADMDLGKPVEVFAVGFRNGFNLLTFQENSPFGGAPIIPPAEGARNTFAAIYDVSGQVATDVSRQVRQGFDAEPLGIAQIPATEGVNPGDLVPIGTQMVFDLNPCAAGGQGYLRQCLAAGRVDLMVSSLAPAQGGPDGGTGDPTYPSFYSRENPTAIALGKYTTLEYVVTVRNPADFDQSGFVDTDDFDAFVHAYENGDSSADIDGSCFVDTDDYDTFVRAFEAG
ncbi:MAG TPA: hypothetical protein VK176_04240 [Phycisphaerales bacterium]|nr:hypothetical protein [Phycisphaerales bacterium]